MKEYSRTDILKRLIQRKMNATQAARLLKLSTRQIRRLKQRFVADGPNGLVHRGRGKVGNRHIPNKERNKIVSLLKGKYADFHPTHANEKLADVHGIIRDVKTIRSIMMKEELWKPKVKRKDKHHEWRLPKAFYGEMQQFDGSYHHWVEDRSTEKWCLLLSTDDATSAITHGRFDEHEGVLPVFNFWQEYLKLHGKPRSIYVDRFSTYTMSQKIAQNNHDTKTQFERALRSLRIEPIFARSAEAKGRVENKFKTLQNRLIKEMRLKGICTMEEANTYLQQEFIPWFNNKYAKEPRSKENLHKRLDVKERKKLSFILSRQIDRTVQNDYTISIFKQWYQVLNVQSVTVRKREKVIASEQIDGSLHFILRGKRLNVVPIDKRPRRDKHAIPWVIPATSKSLINKVKVGHF